MSERAGNVDFAIVNYNIGYKDAQSKIKNILHRRIDELYKELCEENHDNRGRMPALVATRSELIRLLHEIK
jgi:hypothetical protein